MCSCYLTSLLSYTDLTYMYIVRIRLCKGLVLFCLQGTTGVRGYPGFPVSVIVMTRMQLYPLSISI